MIDLDKYLNYKYTPNKKINRLTFKYEDYTLTGLDNTNFNNSGSMIIDDPDAIPGAYIANPYTGEYTPVPKTGLIKLPYNPYAQAGPPIDPNSNINKQSGCSCSNYNNGYNNKKIIQDFSTKGCNLEKCLEKVYGKGNIPYTKTNQGYLLLYSDDRIADAIRKCGLKLDEDYILVTLPVSLVMIYACISGTILEYVYRKSASDKKRLYQICMALIKLRAAKSYKNISEYVRKSLYETTASFDLFQYTSINGVPVCDSEPWLADTLGTSSNKHYSTKLKGRAGTTTTLYTDPTLYSLYEYMSKGINSYNSNGSTNEIVKKYSNVSLRIIDHVPSCLNGDFKKYLYNTTYDYAYKYNSNTFQVDGPDTIISGDSELYYFSGLHGNIKITLSDTKTSMNPIVSFLVDNNIPFNNDLDNVKIRDIQITSVDKYSKSKYGTFVVATNKDFIGSIFIYDDSKLCPEDTYKGTDVFISPPKITIVKIKTSLPSDDEVDSLWFEKSSVRLYDKNTNKTLKSGKELFYRNSGSSSSLPQFVFIGDYDLNVEGHHEYDFIPKGKSTVHASEYFDSINLLSNITYGKITVKVYEMDGRFHCRRGCENMPDSMK